MNLRVYCATLTSIWAVSSASVLAQQSGSDSPFVHSPPPAPTASSLPPCPTEAGSWLPIRCWQGKKFIFLPREKSLQEFGYSSFHYGSGAGPSVAYMDAVGKLATVTAVKFEDQPYIGKLWTIALKMDETGRQVTTSTTLMDKGDLDSGRVDGIAQFSDLQAARQKLKGQDFYIMLPRLLPPDTEREPFIQYPHYSKVKIADVLAGNSELKPVRIVVQFPDGKEGYVDVGPQGTGSSGTNADGKGSPPVYDTFDRHFSKTDPRAVHAWPAKIWSAIEAGTVVVGMTKEQMLFSITGSISMNDPSPFGGLVRNINRTTQNGHAREQWVMDPSTGYRYLYFEDQVLTAIQD